MRNVWMVPMFVLAASCADSNQEQRRALVHQQNQDVAAANAEYGVAGDQQRQAQDAHAKAVKKAINEGKPIPPQTAPGDVPPPPQ